jgi:WD40 repeat protein
MLIATDLRTGERLAKYSAHYGPLNSIAVTLSGGRELVLTGGDDGVARVWDLSLDGKDPVAEFDDGRDCPVTAVEWSADGNQCFVGGVDNEVKVWDLRTVKVVYTLHGHTDTVSGPVISSFRIPVLSSSCFIFAAQNTQSVRLLMLPHNGSDWVSGDRRTRGSHVRLTRTHSALTHTSHLIHWRLGQQGSLPYQPSVLQFSHLLIDLMALHPLISPIIMPTHPSYLNV